MSELPAGSYLRQPDLVGESRVTIEEAAANRARGAGVKRPRAGRRGLLPFSGATLWRKVAAGEFPAPVKLSDRVTAWSSESVAAWLAQRAALTVKAD